MTTFAQALVLIEGLLNAPALTGNDFERLKNLLAVHAADIVQLARVAEEMRGSFIVRYDEGDESHVAARVDHLDLGEAGKAYDALMKKGE